ncbi:MAG TPA: bifunctional precorrin-2 dehydrogenase/sirohydrochlorin ferrochelatase [Bryobacteraceae bacterium]|nr:bifunctional precorrin-2 dehydrogenase/sirohydrochlorin ferrochelatase [Bryobacteraceae bacterium]
MSYYPVFLDLRHREVLVVGAGNVALRKVRGLIEAGAIVTVVSPEVSAGFEQLPVTMRKRRFRPSDIASQALVFTATNDRKTNHRVASLATQKRIPVNVADAPQECTFIVPARVNHKDVQIAISTGGRSPRLAKSLREKLERLLSGGGMIP